MIAKLTAEDHARLREMHRNGASITELMTEFRISESTVERYKYDNLRDLSRRVQQRRNKIEAEKVCYECGLFKRFHPKCARCEIFVHNGKDYCNQHLPSSE